MRQAEGKNAAAAEELRTELEALLTRLATYCALDANGDEARFLRSGFDLRSQPGPVGQLPKPSSFKFVLGENAGEAIASMEAFPKARGFSFAWTPDPLNEASVWTVVPFPKRVYLFSGLPSGKKVWAKGGAVSSDGTVNYSDPISRIIQ